MLEDEAGFLENALAQIRKRLEELKAEAKKAERKAEPEKQVD